MADCKNRETPFGKRDVEAVADLIFYPEDGVIYCFECVDINELLKTGKNPWTDKELSSAFVHKIARLRQDLRSSDNQLTQLLTLYPDKPWDWAVLSWNLNITIEFVKDHPDTAERQWDWVGLSRNPNITMADVENHPELPWEWNGSFTKSKYNHGIR